jgi:hypothetical protein
MPADRIPADQSIIRTSSGVVCQGSGILDRIWCNTQLSAAVTLTDGRAGALLLTLPASWPAGSILGKVGPLNVAFTKSLTATFGGSGSLTFVYR